MPASPMDERRQMLAEFVRTCRGRFALLHLPGVTRGEGRDVAAIPVPEASRVAAGPVAERPLRKALFEPELVRLIHEVERAMARKEKEDAARQREESKQLRRLMAQRRRELRLQKALRSPRMNSAKRDPEIRRLWLERPEGQRTDNDVLPFYGWLWHNRRELLPRKRGCGDYQYQQLFVILSGLIWRNGTPPATLKRSGRLTAEQESERRRRQELLRPVREIGPMLFDSLQRTAVAR